MRKSIILTMFLMSTVFTVNAQRVVALHSSSGVTVFSSISPFIDAYNAAQAGDTLYLPGGAFAAPSLIEADRVAPDPDFRSTPLHLTEYFYSPAATHPIAVEPPLRIGRTPYF